MKRIKFSSKLSRILGPVCSVLVHVGLVLLLIHTIGFVSKPKDEAIRFEMSEFSPINIDDVVLPQPPDFTDKNPLDPEPIKPEDLSAITPSDELNVDTEDDTVNMLDNLSPLVIQGVGADLSSRGALTSRYGSRAVKNGLLGSYFNRVDFTGETFMRIDETLNDAWELDSPWPGRVREDLFSIIWTGRIVPPRSGTYTFYLQSDDGARLWIDGKLVLDQFVERQRETDEVQIPMLVGKSYDIKYVFCDVFRHAVSRLEWRCDEAGIARQLVPSEYLWADGPSTRQLIAWNEEVRRGTSVQYPNREKMRNPAMIEGVPFSQIVGFEQLDADALTRLELPAFAADLQAYRKNGRAPAESLLPSIPVDAAGEHAEPVSDGQDVIITVM